MTVLALILGEYFYLRERLPIFLYIFYIHFKEEDNLIIDTGIFAGLLTIGMITAYALIGFILKIPFKILIPFSWHYQGLLTWATFFFLCYYTSLSSTHSKLTSFTLAALATVGGGWLYEIPFYHPQSMFVLHNSIFYISGQIICLLLLAYELQKMNLKPNKLIYGTLGLLLTNSILLFNNISLLQPWHTWVIRIPACLFLLSLLGGINNHITNPKKKET